MFDPGKRQVVTVELKGAWTVESDHPAIEVVSVIPTATAVRITCYDTPVSHLNAAARILERRSPGCGMGPVDAWDRNGETTESPGEAIHQPILGDSTTDIQGVEIHGQTELRRSAS